MNLYQDVFFRGLDLLRGRRTIERLHFLRQSQQWDPAALRGWQLEKLNALLQHARQNSVYYEKAIAGIKLPLGSLNEFHRVPVLTKDAIRSNLEAIGCRNVPRNRFVMSRTGGSTAEPMHYYWDKRGMDWNRASVYRSAEWAGVALGERAVHMSGSHFDYTQSQKWFSRLVYFLQRYRDYSVAYLTDELLEKYYEGICAWRPTSLWGYASGLNVFAEYIQKRHPGASFDFIRAIATSSETLRPEHRKNIDAVFGNGKVHDQYGSREMYIGAECRQHRGYHLHAEILLVEVVDKENRPCPRGESGRILLTDLSNHASPFIRYEIGDVGVMDVDEPCPCGVTLPRLARVEGRIADLVVLRDRILTPPNFATLFSDMRGIKAYQIRQDSMDRLDVLIVPDRDYKDDFARYVGGAIEQMVGKTVEVVVRKVSEIPVAESGKRRYVVSSVSKSRV
jgi:phenylacetate-CoA ligase